MKNNTRLQDIPVAQKINAGVEGSPRSPRTRSEKLRAAGDAIVGGRPLIGEKRVDMRQITLSSAPVIILQKAIYTNLGRTKTLSLGGMKMAEGKLAADGMMASLESNDHARYARVDKGMGSLHPGKKRFPHIEVLELEGHTLLGVPGGSRVKQYSSFNDRGKKKQLLIAIHQGKPLRKSGGGGGETRGLSQEAEAAVMRSGVNGLSKQLGRLRESLGSTRGMHNTFNEIPKYNLDL